MSKQMTEDWIEQEYDRWSNNDICDPLNQAERCQYVARAFALHILKKSASFHGFPHKEEKDV